MDKHKYGYNINMNKHVEEIFTEGYTLLLENFLEYSNKFILIYNS